MASTGWGDYLQSIQQDSSSGTSWSINSSAKTASVSLSKNSDTRFLQVYNLSVVVPDDAEITKIGLSYDYTKTTSNTVTEREMSCGDVSGDTGMVNVTQAEGLGANGTVEHDYPISTWRGSLITPSMINDSNFGFQLSLSRRDDNSRDSLTVDISGVKCKIEYIQKLMVNYWNGSAWISKPMMVRSSTGWVPVTWDMIKKWNGSSWA